MEEEVPFIGDIFLPDRGVFEGTCIKGSLPVSDLNIQDNIFEIEVNLSSAINRRQLNERDAQVVIGVDVEIKGKDDPWRRGSVQSNVLKGIRETVNLPVGASVLSGQLKIVQYRLVPVEELQNLGNYLNRGKNSNFDPRDLKNVSVFQELNSCMEEADEISNDDEKLSLMTFDSKNKLKHVQNTLRDCKREFVLRCLPCFQDMNTGHWGKHVCSLIEGLEICSGKAEICGKELKGIVDTDLKGKAAFLEGLREMGIRYVSDSRIFDRAIGQDDCFAMFFNQDLVKRNISHFRKTAKFFKEFIEQGGRDQEFIAVDLDVIPSNELRVPIPKEVVIYHLQRNEIVSLDLMSDSEKRLSTAKCEKRGDELEPKQRGKFKIPCPNSFRGSCLKDCLEWLCEECNTNLDYGFNDCLYCNCNDGKGTNLEEFRFRCSDLKHGFEYVSYNHRCSDYLNRITPLENISIVILGQSGVGKSTWINGIINYVLYNDIEVAKSSQIVNAIPTKITKRDQYKQMRVIEIGKDENEDTGNVGASGTQDCRTYNIRYTTNNKNYNIQLIDTPGLGDDRGIEQDRINIKKILDYIRYFEQIHGFCVLLKPNESKIQILMKFCIKEILTHLHKSCAENIVYCFTHTRSTFYRPGETRTVLEALLREINVRMPLNKSTIYCFDNEAYEYLCTLNYKGVKYSKKDEESFEESWDKSVTETKRLLDYVVKLNPHLTQETSTLNQSRRMILSLTRPIADITHNIEMNIQIVSDHQKLIESMDEKDRNLLKNLYVPQVVLENVALGHPRTVCTAEKCVERHTLPSGVQITEYVTHCHVHCYLKNITEETYPNPGLKHCAAMDPGRNKEFCMVCGCSWETHMHIKYDQTRSEIQVKNQSVAANIGNKSDLRKEKEQAIQDLKRQVVKLKDEKQKIIQIAGKFAYFLKKHAITPYNDCFLDYLDYLIDAEERKRFKTEKDKAILYNLKKTKATYEEEVEILDMAMANSPNSGNYAPQDVEKWQEELYNLPIHGTQLRNNMNIVIEAEDNAARYTQKNFTGSKKTSSSWIGSSVNALVQGIRNLNPFSSKSDKKQEEDDDDYRYSNRNNYKTGGYRNQSRGRGRGRGKSQLNENWRKRD